MALDLQIEAKALADPGTQTALSVQDRADAKRSAFDGPLIFRVGHSADELPAWWSQSRDKKLEELYRQEPVLAGAIYSLAAKASAARWKLKGPEQQVEWYTEVLNAADFGQGWIPFIFRTVTDFLTQDNGMFWEILREKGQGNEMPVQGIAHLDSQRCTRTGVAELPLKYYSAVTGKVHILKWWQAFDVSDMPSPREQWRGVGYCGTSRAARAAQILRDINTYKRQKIGGKRLPAVMWVSGMRYNAVQDALEEALSDQETKGMSHYAAPVILAAQDAAVDLKVKLIEFAGLPDGYDEDETMRWYIAILAMCFGTDYSDFAPLPGRALGTATESLVQKERSAGKGAGVVFNTIERAVNWSVLPDDVRFSFIGKDASEDEAKAEIAKTYSEVLENLITSGVLSPEQAGFIGINWLGLPDDIQFGGVSPGGEGGEGEGTEVGAVEGGVAEDEDQKALETDRILLALTQFKQDDDEAKVAALAALWAEYSADIERAYDAWAADTAVAVSDADEDDRFTVFDAAMASLLVELARLGEDYMAQAFDSGLGGTDPDPADRAALAAAIASNQVFLEASLGPDLVERFAVAAGVVGFIWAVPELTDLLGSWAYRPQQYVWGVTAPFWTGVGADVRKRFGAMQPPVRRLLDPEAEHCATCIPKAGAYGSWAVMVSAVGIPGDGSDDCLTFCKCFIEMQMPDGSWQILGG